MKKVIFCETPFQIITSLYIRKQFSCENDSFDIVITNTFNGYDIFAERIEKLGIYDKVIIADAKSIIKSISKKDNFKRLYYMLNLNSLIKNVFKDKIDFYDEMYCWNYDLLTSGFRSYLAEKKHPAKIFIYDEGYITYMPINEVIPLRGFQKLIEHRNKIFGIANITRDNIDGMLLFEPDFLIYKPNCTIFKIDRKIGEKKEFRDNIDYIFKAKDILPNYDKKYIIFEEAMLANSDNVDDYSIYKDLIEKLGCDNVIVKLHPRTKEDRFSSLGVKVMGSDGIPWEAIMIAGQFKDKILITIGSGSITNCRMLFGGDTESYMLFKIVKPDLQHFQEKYYELWDKISNSTDSGGLHIPKTMDEFYKDILRKEK